MLQAAHIRPVTKEGPHRVDNGLLLRSDIHTLFDQGYVTVTPEHTIDECMVIMTQARVRHLPVMIGERIAGIVSIGDLVNAIISDQAETINHLHTYITGSYPS